MKPEEGHSSADEDTRYPNGVVPLSMYMDLQKRHAHLLGRVAEMGFDMFEELSEVKKDRLAVMEYIREKHGKLKVTVNDFSAMTPAIRRECMDYLQAKLGNHLRAQSRVKEAFDTPVKKNKWK